MTDAPALMSVAFISDLHLTPERPASTRLFKEFLGQAARRLERLYILGDLFDYWVGDDGGAPLGHGGVETALRRTAEAGTRIFCMRGNRDFLIGGAFAERAGCELLPDPVIVELPGPGPAANRRFLLSHGDALCTDDVEHQASRREMLSAKWKTAFLQKPLPRRMEAAAAMRRRSEEAKRHKTRAVMDVNQAAVENLMRQHGADTLVHGHTHLPAVHRFSLDGKPAWRYVLGDWYEQRSALYYHRGILALKK